MLLHRTVGPTAGEKGDLWIEEWLMVPLIRRRMTVDSTAGEKDDC